MSETRAALAYCPYCGDEDLHPAEQGGWECRACLRVFRVSLLGLAPRPSPTTESGVTR
jgi:ribosomal protein L37AE/L43A